MRSEDEKDIAVRAKVALIDPASMTVVWSNASDTPNQPEQGEMTAAGAAVEQVVPMAAALGVPEALRRVAEIGLPQHLRADLFSTSRGSMALTASIYRLPDGKLLVLTEHTWYVKHETGEGSTPRRTGRRGR